MTTASILLGAVLTFGTTDGRELQLTLSLTEPATVALSWGELAKSSTIAAKRHVLRGLPVPREAPLTYALAIGREPVRTKTVQPMRPDVLRVAVYGDSRDGAAPHQILVEQIDAARPNVLLHTGDVVRTAADEAGWVTHLSTSLPVSAEAPVILSLGNHELIGRDQVPFDALERAMNEIPPPDDPIARALGVPRSVFHVRVGPVLFVSLDSNAPLGKGSPQHTFLDRVLLEKGDAKWTIVSYHHGPRSSGPHGPHASAADVIALLERHHVTMSIAGHDHTYERIERGGPTYVVSGGGGAPLYARSRYAPGSAAFSSTYNWVQLDVAPEGIALEARSLEGVLLDRATITGRADDAPQPWAPFGSASAPVAIALLAVGLVYVVVRLMRPSAAL
ncbi:metallophosphoesterase [Myxococcota bacterium]|nr:metallophosphoesterase [Myxococcota bacterium]